MRGHLDREAIPSRVVYWNVLLAHQYESLFAIEPEAFERTFATRGSTDCIFLLAPFLYEQLRREDRPKDRHAFAQLMAYWTSKFRQTAVMDPSFPSRSLADLSEDVVQVIDRQLAEVDWSSVALWGVQFKCHQWVAGMIVAEKARALRPDLLIVLGFVTTEVQARTIMDRWPAVDYAIWGEGEGPLTALYRGLESGRPRLERIPRLLYRGRGGIAVSSFDGNRRAALPERRVLTANAEHN